MDIQDFDLKPEETYTASIEWNGLEDGESTYALFIDGGPKIPLDKLGEYLSTFEGWKIDLKIHS